MELLVNLLTETEETSSSAATTNGGSSWVIWVILIGFMVVMFIMSSRSRRKQQEQLNDRLNALKPGDRISTIGLIQGVIEEIYEDGIILISTGSDDKKSYLTIERNAIYRTIPDVAPLGDETATEENAPSDESVEPFDANENVEEAIDQIQTDSTDANGANE